MFLTLTAMCAFYLGFTLNNRANVKAGQAQIVSEIKDVYLLGETFTFDQVQISYNQQTYSSIEGVLITPNGDAYTQGTYQLNDTGDYLLKYSFKTDDGEYLVAQKDFTVQQLLYSVSSELSSFEFVEECPHYEKMDNYTAPWEVLNKDEKGVVDFNASILPSALTVKLAEGETFYYNSPVNLDRDIVNSLVHFYTPQYIDNYVAERIIIRITDCFDQNNYIDIVNEYSRAIDFRTALPGTTSRYMSKGNTLNVEHDKSYINGESYVSRKEEDWGITLVASSPNPTVFVRDVKVGFNYDTSWTYAMSPSDEWVAIIDTTNQDFFKDKAFKGFTSNQVYISIRGENYAKSDLLELSIMEIAGVKGDDLKVTNYFDNQKPVIKVDYNPTDHNGVYIVKDSEFKIFDAMATDINLIGKVNAQVFYTSSGVPITVNQVNGKFTPKNTGEYNIVYSAKDKYGNIAYETVSLMCVETLNGQGATITTEKLSQVKVGEDVVVPYPNIESVNGNQEVTAKILSADGKVYDVDFSSSIILDKAGDYKLVYTYGDLYYQYTYEYTFNAVHSNVVRFIDKPVLPIYLMAGKDCSIEALKVYDFTNPQVAIKDALTSVSFDGGEYCQIDVKKFNVDINASKAKFKYSYPGVQTYYSEEIPVINVGTKSKIDIRKYFVGDFDAQALTDGIIFTTQNNDDNAKLEYINKTILNGFELKFKILKNYDNFESFNIVFTDYYNRQNQIKLTFIKNNGAMSFNINGNGGYHVRNDFASDTENITVTYNPLTECFNLGGIGEYSFKHNFKSGYCFISFELEKVEGQSKIVLQQLLNQTLSDVSRDKIGPVVSYVSKINTAKIGQQFVIERAYVADVLSGVVDSDINLLVTDPDGNFVTSVDNVLLDGTCDINRDYVISLDKAGDYSILYNAKDTNGYQTTSPGWLSLNVRADEQGPDVIIENNKSLSPVTVSLGANHLVKVGVSDNYTKQQDVVVSVGIFNNEQGNYVYFNLLKYNDGSLEQANFTAKLRGKYTVYVYAYDQVGNITVKNYTLNVK